MTGSKGKWDMSMRKRSGDRVDGSATVGKRQNQLKNEKATFIVLYYSFIFMHVQEKIKHSLRTA